MSNVTPIKIPTGASSPIDLKGVPDLKDYVKEIEQLKKEIDVLKSKKTIQKLNLRFRPFKDNIHDNIWVSDMACAVIDSPIFQRTSHLAQLGVCSKVFPPANHTRFVHSLGCYHLTGELLKNLIINTPEREINEAIFKIPELSEYSSLDERLQEIIKIAGLCHDIGHGPFSHVFDDILLKDSIEPLAKHELRSCVLLEEIIKLNNISITAKELAFMKNLIDPNKDIHNGFLYQIISNKRNGVDTDKLDYLCRDAHNLPIKLSLDLSRIINNVRVVNNNICYDKKISFDLYLIFFIRYMLHKQVYTNKTVIAIQSMMIDIMKNIDHLLGLTDSIKDLKKFVSVHDNRIHGFLESTEYQNDLKFQLAKKIHDDIKNRRIHVFIGEDVFSTEGSKNSHNSDQKTTSADLKNMVQTREITANDICKCDPSIKLDDLYIYKTTIGLISGKCENPLKNIFLYKINKKTGEIKLEKYNSKKVSMMIAEDYQETIIKVYCKNRDPIVIEKVRSAYTKLTNSIRPPTPSAK